MATPTGVLWERDPHTAAKHALLQRYLMAWFPIMAKRFRHQGITFFDAFAGPGEYSNSEISSPAIACNQSQRSELSDCIAVRLLFIEEDRRRFDHLSALVERKFPASGRPSNMSVGMAQGRCDELFEAQISGLGGWNGPIFANLDGWGVDSPFWMVQRFAKHVSSEVLVTVKQDFFVRFASVADNEAGDRVFGSTEWRDVTAESTPDRKQAFLFRAYQARLRAAGFDYVLSFEMQDEGGHSLHQFFATRSLKAVEKFKEALWSVDTVSGRRFRDPRDPDQIAFDVQRPDFTLLDHAVAAKVEFEGTVDLETLREFVLRDTMYKPTHTKPSVDRLVQAGKLEQIANGRSPSEKRYQIAHTLFGFET